MKTLKYAFRFLLRSKSYTLINITRREDAFVKGERSLWTFMSMDGKIVEGGLTLMPVQAIIEDYYSGHLTAGKKPIIYMVSRGGINAQCQIACVPGKEQQLKDYLRKSREEVLNTSEISYRWLKDDIIALYRNDRRVTTVFTLFAAISIFVSDSFIYSRFCGKGSNRHRHIHHCFIGRHRYFARYIAVAGE